MKKLGILIENNPYAEVGGKGKYPCLRALLGTYVAMAKLLDTKISFIVMNKATLQVNKDIENDVSYLDRIGVKYEILPFDTDSEFEYLVSGIMQYRPEWHYRVLDNLAKNTKNHLIYIDSDHEPTARATTVFNSIDKFNLCNVKNKLKYVLTNSCVTNNDWIKVAPNSTTLFLPLITHPYYKVTPRVQKSKIRGVVAMRTGESKKVQDLIEKYDVQQIVPPGLFSKRLLNMDELHYLVGDYKVLLGTMMANSGTGEYYRSTTKVFEALHSGALPTVMAYRDKDLTENRYPYLTTLPDELKILTSEKNIDIDKLEVCLSTNYPNHTELVDELYRSVMVYHDESNWVDTIESVFN